MAPLVMSSLPSVVHVVGVHLSAALNYLGSAELSAALNYLGTAELSQVIAKIIGWMKWL